MLAQDRQPLIERQERLAVGPGLGIVGAEELADQRAAVARRSGTQPGVARLGQSSRHEIE